MRGLQRRSFLFAAGALLAAPLRLRAQQPGNVRRIGYLSLEPASEGKNEIFTDALRDIGYEEGKNIVIEWRWGNRNPDSLPALVADLVDRRVELIVGFSNDEIAAAKQATQKIPIVMLWSGAPVEAGLIGSLSHPGGNVTGTTYFEPEMLTRSFQLLNEVKPSATRVAVLWTPGFKAYSIGMAMVDRLAASLQVRMEYFEVTRAEQLLSALERIAASRPDGLFFLQSPVFYYRVAEIGAMAVQRKLPSIATIPAWVDRQGLLAYYPDTDAIMQRTVTYVDRILRGAKPADLPVEQPSRYRLAINLKTAKAIGLSIPRSVLLQADRVIE